MFFTRLGGIHIVSSAWRSYRECVGASLVCYVHIFARLESIGHTYNRVSAVLMGAAAHRPGASNLTWRGGSCVMFCCMELGVTALGSPCDVIRALITRNAQPKIALNV